MPCFGSVVEADCICRNTELACLEKCATQRNDHNIPKITMWILSEASFRSRCNVAFISLGISGFVKIARATRMEEGEISSA